MTKTCWNLHGKCTRTELEFSKQVWAPAALPVPVAPARAGLWRTPGSRGTACWAAQNTRSMPACHVMLCKSMQGAGRYGLHEQRRTCTPFLKGMDMHWRQALHWTHGHMAERCAWPLDMHAALCHLLLCTA